MTMNWNEIFDLYVKKDDMHEWMQKPFLNMKDDTVWATDGHAAFIIPTIMADQIYPSHDVNFKLPELISLNSCPHYTTEQLMAAIDRCGKEEIMEEKEVKCPECDGEGMVLWEYRTSREDYEHEYECPVCEGEGHIYKEVPTGRFEPSHKCGIRIGEGVYSAWQIDRVVKTMKLLNVDTLNIVSKTDRFHAVLFQFGIMNVHVLQMPMLAEAETDITEI